MTTKLDFACAAGGPSPTRASRIFGLLLLGGLNGLSAGCAPVDDTASFAQTAVDPPVATTDVRSTFAPGVIATPVDTASARTVIAPGVVAAPLDTARVGTVIAPGVIATPVDTASVRTVIAPGVTVTPVDTSDVRSVLTPGAIVAATESRDPRARLAPGVVATPIDFGDPMTRLVAGGAAPLPAAGTFNPSRSALSNVLGELSFETGAFVGTVNRLATAYSVKGGALTMVPVSSSADAHEWINAYVAAAGNVDATAVSHQRYDCPTAVACAGSFLYSVSSSRADYGMALVPAATRIATTASDVATTLWTPMYNGMPLFEVLTLHGTVNSHLVGLVYFR